MPPPSKWYFSANTFFLVLMGSVDIVLERYPNGVRVFMMIFVLRSLQGFAVGLLFQIVQVNQSPIRKEC